MRYTKTQPITAAVKRVCALAAGAVIVSPSATASMTEGVIVETPAYRWEADTIFQGPFKAYAPNDEEIISDYYAQPGYFMPIDKTWKRRNDLSAYPRLHSSNTLHDAIYTMGLDEMVNAIEPDSTLRTGKEWPGVWTRDVSYSIILAMAALQPEVSRISLEHKISPTGRIIQDTGSGGAWPVSSDRQIWGIAAFEVYKSTGDKAWLEKIYPVIKNSLEDDYQTIYDPETGLVRGETSFIDWREQSYPKWMQTADIYQSEALGTSVVHAKAWRTLAEIASILGHKEEAATYTRRADKLAEAINRELWMEDKGYYAMYRYGREFPILNPRAETLGESLAILYDVADPGRARVISQKNPVTPFGPGIFFPQIADMPPYHNNALWPWVAAYWTLANAKAGNSEGVMQGIGSIFRPAALFATNKENFVLDNGDIATELNSSNMLWCLSGNIALTLKMLFGVRYETDGLRFSPFIPKAMADTRTLTGLRYRDAVLNITVTGYGDRVKSFKLNGREHAPFIPADIRGENDIRIVMDDNNPLPARVNETPNVKAPLTPSAWLSNDPALDGEGIPVNNLLRWNPIEYIGHYDVYRDGNKVASTRETSYNAVIPGEYMVVGVSDDGVEGFASEPRSNRPVIIEQMPDETTRIASPEACNLPKSPVLGFRGNGFAELDKSTGEIAVPVNIRQGGTYALTLRYANGNGPVNTENKCAIRSVYIDGKRLGTIVMPQRGVGNWNDWGTTNVLEAPLTAGRHVISIRYTPLDANMNGATNHSLVDQLMLTRIRP